MSSSLGVVAIGRNEGERLRRCLESLTRDRHAVVYVDSGSRDGSVELARSLGVGVVELDLSIPFTAARARNEGFRRLRALHPGIELVQFLDGDCELVATWIPAAVRELHAHPSAAVVCGRRRERFRDATVYNTLCDIEWDTPVGEAEACGGDALMRAAAFEKVGGFDPTLIAGEEPDLCFRLRKQGNLVLRIAEDMTLHDAAMTRWIQWWRRMVRSGYAASESMHRRGAETPRIDRRSVRGVVLWIFVLPAFAALAIVVAAVRVSVSAALVVAGLAVAAVCAQIVRTAIRCPSKDASTRDAFVYAVSCLVAKLPQSVGMLRYFRDRVRGRTPHLIEYK